MTRAHVVKRATLVALVALLPGRPVLAAEAAADGAAPGWWTNGNLIHYGVAATGLGVYFLWHVPPGDARIGPVFDEANPSAIADPAYASTIGNPYTPESRWTVPDSWVQLTAYSQALLVPLNEWAGRRGPWTPLRAHALHDAVLGAVETTGAVAALTSVAKSWFGRLRPDFADRARHVYCSSADNTGFDCAGVDPTKLPTSDEGRADVLKDGRKSFWSGHSSTAFGTATWLALQSGGLYVWGEGATPRSRAFGIAGMGVLGAAATFCAVSRTSLMDGVHHGTDVLVGSLVGAGFANLFYWLHFDTSGRPRAHAPEPPASAVRDLQLAPTAWGDTPGLLASGRF